MLSPNTTANTSTGITTKMAEVGPSSPKSFPPTPYWKTSTMSPKVALTESVFIITALIGTSTDRKAMASMTAGHGEHQEHEQRELSQQSDPANPGSTRCIRRPGSSRP